jgi:hypothetical protein
MSGNPNYTGAFTLTWSGNLTETRTETSTTEVPVPYTWLDGYFAGQGTSAQAYETLANADQDGDGFTTWQEYLAGTDPTSAASQLRATIRMEGSVPIVEYAPTNEVLKASGAIEYRLQGRPTLTNKWEYCPSFGDPGDTNRFFRVKVIWGQEAEKP